MITPSYGITASERVLPNFALDFTTAALDPRVTITRSLNTATRINSSGLIELVNADLPRFDHNPSTLICRGLLREDSRANLLLNSTIDGANLATQSVTVTAAAHTISFYGTGTITLSGTHSATVTGTGAYPSRVTYTFTPTAGSLTCTVSGAVQFAQLEAGDFATSFIPTAGTSVTRSADVVAVTNLSPWFNSAQGAMVTEFSRLSYSATAGSPAVAMFSDGTTSNRLALRLGSGTTGTSAQLTIVNAGSLITNTNGGNAATFLTPAKAAASYIVGTGGVGSAGAAIGVSIASLPTASLTLTLGTGPGSLPISGHFQKFSYFPQRLIPAELAASTK